MSERDTVSVANGLGTLWFLVLSVWCFMKGYTPLWLAGVAAALVSFFIVRAVVQYKERGK